MFETATIEPNLRKVMEAGYAAEYGYAKPLPNLMGYNSTMARMAVARIVLSGGSVEKAFCTDLGIGVTAFKRGGFKIEPEFRRRFAAMKRAAEEGQC